MSNKFGGVFIGSTLVYDQPESVSIFQPYIRVIVDLQVEGTPVVIKNSEGSILMERKPRTQYAVIFLTSPKLIEGETYTIIVGDDIIETAVAKIDVLKEEE